MKVLQIIASCDPVQGGPSEGVRRIADALVGAGHDAHVLTLDPAGSPWLADFAGAVHAHGGIRGDRTSQLGRVQDYLRGAPAARDWLKRHAQDFDGAIVHGLWKYSTRLARDVLPRAGVPYVVFSHGMLAPIFARERVKHLAKRLFWRVNEGVLLRSAAAVAFTSTHERDAARTTFRNWNMREAVVGFGTVAPPARTEAMEGAFRNAVPGLGGRRYLLFMGRISAVKGCDDLIDAFAAVALQWPDVDLVLAGPAEPALLADLSARAKGRGIAGRLHWPGMIDGDAKWGAVYGCDALVLASHHENFGVVVAEAMACARPVVITDRVNIHPAVAAAGAGLIARDNPDAFAERLREFLSLTPDERAAMGQRGGALFRAEFDIVDVSDRLIAILEDARAGIDIPRAPSAYG